MTNESNPTETEQAEHLARRLIDEDILANQTALVEDLLHGEPIEGFAVECDAEDPVYEWWLVTRQLADELRRAGETVIDNGYGRWWGRKATGQAIRLDGLFQHIAVDLLGKWR